MQEKEKLIELKDLHFIVSVFLIFVKVMINQTF